MEITETIGKTLKLKREEKGISLEVVAQKTKININILKHLESDDLGKLPNKTYVKGFVANYARTVGWDLNEAKEVLDYSYHQFDGTAPRREVSTTNLGALQNDMDITEENEELKETFISIVQSFFNKKVFVSVITVIVLGIIGKYVVTFFSTLNYEHKKIVKTPIKTQDKNILEMDASKKFASELANSTEPSISSEENVQGEAKEETTQSESTILVETAESDSDESAKTPEQPQVKTEEEIKKEMVAKEQEQKPTPKPVVPAGKLPFKKFYQAPASTFEIVASAEEANNPDLLPPNIKASLVEGKQNVYVVATEGDTWIAYKTDDKPIKKYVLKQGRRVLIRGDVVTLFMGNYNVAKVFYNNKLINAETKTGVKSLIFPKQAGKDLKLPLFPTYQGRSYTSAEYIEKMMETQEI